MLDTVKAATHEHKDNHIRNHKTVLLPEPATPATKHANPRHYSTNIRHNM